VSAHDGHFDHIL